MSESAPSHDPPPPEPAPDAPSASGAGLERARRLAFRSAYLAAALGLGGLGLADPAARGFYLTVAGLCAVALALHVALHGRALLVERLTFAVLFAPFLMQAVRNLDRWSASNDGGHLAEAVLWMPALYLGASVVFPPGPALGLSAVLLGAVGGYALRIGLASEGLRLVPLFDFLLSNAVAIAVLQLLTRSYARLSRLHAFARREVRNRLAAERDLADANRTLERRVRDLDAAETRLRAANAELARAAYVDPLTGLPTRAAFERTLAALPPEEAAGRALAYLDLANFADLNDGLGPEVGDALLVSVARRLETALRPDERLARCANDEFVVLLRDSGNPVAAVEALRERVAAPLRLGSHDLHVSVAAGVRRLEADAPPERVIRDAQIAARRAARAGGGATEFRSDDRDRTERRHALEADLRRALEAGEIRVALQPIVRIASGRVEGLEALARWTSPTRGPVPPAEFVPVAEASGLVLALDRAVLRKACRGFATWRARRSDARLHVNLSSRQFLQPDLVGAVAAALRESGVPGSALHLEVTEAVLLEENEQVRANLAGLRGLGCCLAIDDFGTGYSSLAYLQRYPMDSLKIDQAFVRDVTSNPRSAGLVRTILAMAEALGLEVVAEGVETEEQLDFLRRHGCDFAQGFLFSRPVPLEELEEVLAGRE